MISVMWVVAPTGESLFLLQPKKTNEKKAARTPCPQKSTGGSRALQLCQRVGSTRVLLDEPQNLSMNFDPTKVEMLGKMNGDLKNAFL